eukprot:2429714-Karenia_brevis.AAC.1
MVGPSPLLAGRTKFSKFRVELGVPIVLEQDLLSWVMGSTALPVISPCFSQHIANALPAVQIFAATVTERLTQ